MSTERLTLGICGGCGRDSRWQEVLDAVGRDDRRHRVWQCDCGHLLYRSSELETSGGG